MVFFTGVVACSGWVLSSVVYHLVTQRDPLYRQQRISRQADRPEEVFRCYFDMLLLFQTLVVDHGHIPSATMCRNYSLRKRWDEVYGWDAHPWYVVLRSSQPTASDLGQWRYRFYEVWSRCRLNDSEVLERSPVLGQLARAHQDLDELRRVLTRQVHRYEEQAAPLVHRIRKTLAAAENKVDQPDRRMKRERKLIKYRLRRWGIHSGADETCAIGF